MITYIIRQQSQRHRYCLYNSHPYKTRLGGLGGVLFPNVDLGKLVDAPVGVNNGLKLCLNISGIVLLINSQAQNHYTRCKKSKDPLVAYKIKSDKSINLLLISNDEALIKTLFQQLPQWEINTSLAVELKDISQTIKNESPRIILLDAELEIDKARTLFFLKLKRLTNRPAILVCIGDQTADSFKFLFEKMKRMKNIYFISKPVLAKSLISLITDILRNDKKSSVTFNDDSLGYERRKCIRANVNFYLSCQFLSHAEKEPGLHQVGAKAQNVSCEGMMLEIQKPIQLPKVIGLEFSLLPKHQTIMVDGEIKWKHRHLRHRQLMGLKFKGLNNRDQSLIAQYIYTTL